jgi:hypothetical protein
MKMISGRSPIFFAVDHSQPSAFFAIALGSGLHTWGKNGQ